MKPKIPLIVAFLSIFVTPCFTQNQEDIQTIFEFKNIQLSYGNEAILNGINWTVEKNSFWQLVGPNGSGKSTLLSLVIGDNPKAY